MTDDLVYTTLHDVSDGIGNICIECDCHLCTTCVCVHVAIQNLFHIEYMYFAPAITILGYI